MQWGECYKAHRGTFGQVIPFQIKRMDLHNSTFLMIFDHSESGWIFNSNPAADHTNLKYSDTLVN